MTDENIEMSEMPPRRDHVIHRYSLQVNTQAYVLRVSRDPVNYDTIRYAMRVLNVESIN